MEDQHAVARTELLSVVRPGLDVDIQFIEPRGTSFQHEVNLAGCHAAFLENLSRGGQAVFHYGVGPSAAVLRAEFEAGYFPGEDMSGGAELEAVVVSFELETAFSGVQRLHFQRNVGADIQTGAEFPCFSGGVADLHADGIMGICTSCPAVERDCEIAVRVSRERPRAYGIAAVGYGVADVGGSEAVAGVCLYIPSDLDAVARKMKHVILRPCEIEAGQHEFVRQHMLRGENPSLMFDEYRVISSQAAFLKHEASRCGTEFSGGDLRGREFLVFRVEQSRCQPEAFSG